MKDLILHMVKFNGMPLNLILQRYPKQATSPPSCDPWSIPRTPKTISQLSGDYSISSSIPWSTIPRPFNTCPPQKLPNSNPFPWTWLRRTCWTQIVIISSAQDLRVIFLTPSHLMSTTSVLKGHRISELAHQDWTGTWGPTSVTGKLMWTVQGAMFIGAEKTYWHFCYC